jgi:hypothetical protein
VVIFGIASPIMSGLDCNPAICACPCSWDARNAPLHAAIGWDGVLWVFWPGWPWIMIFPISTSQVASVIGLSHHVWLENAVLLLRSH